MSYSDELCQLVIRNMEIIEEAPSVVEQVEEKLFTAINERIKERIGVSEGWVGTYEFYTGKKDQTTFAVKDWPVDGDGALLTYFTLHHVEAGEEYSWLSNAIGFHGSALCLQFMVKPDFTGLNAKEYKKRLHDFYSNTSALAEAGFLVAKNGTIYRPFAFDAAKVAEEYPDFDEVLAPLDAAMNDVVRTHKAFDGFVRTFSK